MNVKKLSVFSLLFLLAVSCSKDPMEAGPAVGNNNNNNFILPENHEPGWVRLKFSRLDQPLNTVQTRSGEFQTGIPELDEVAALLGATQIERVFNEGGKFKERREKYGLHLWYDFYVGEEQPITRSMRSFADLPFVETVELIPVEKQAVDMTESLANLVRNYNAIHSFSMVPQNAGDGFKFNDPYLTRQWHYYNDGSTAASVAGADANIFPAWKVTTGDPRVIVAVIDGGVDYNHPDLKQNMWINPGEIAGNGKDDDNNGYIDDIYGYVFGKSGLMNDTGDIFPMDHGTHVAGTIAAVNNNGIGLAGVAGGNGSPNSGVRIMTLQTYVPDPAYPDDPHGNSKSTSRTADAYAYAADNGAVIINASYMYGGTSLSSAYKAGIDYFIDNAGLDENGNQAGPMKGGLLVAAAGNDGLYVAKYPASYERVMSVAYMRSDYTKSTSSNYGPWIDIYAPGGATSKSYAANKVGGVFSTVPMDSKNYDVSRGYGYKSGTSMAAPHVSGVAALVVSAALENNIPMTADKLRNILESTTRDVTSYEPEYAGMLGHGLLDAGAAIDKLLSEVVSTPDPEPNPDPNPTPEPGDSYQFDLYPNPVKTQLNIQPDKSLAGQTATIEIFDSNGKSVHKENKKLTNSPFKINMNKQKSGTYTVVMTVNGEKEEQTIVKQ